MPDVSRRPSKEYRKKHNRQYYENYTRKTSPFKCERTEQAICYKCKKPFRARKDQHPKYSICEPCRAKNARLTGAARWLSARSWI